MSSKNPLLNGKFPVLVFLHIARATADTRNFRLQPCKHHCPCLSLYSSLLVTAMLKTYINVDLCPTMDKRTEFSSEGTELFILGKARQKHTLPTICCELFLKESYSKSTNSRISWAYVCRRRRTTQGHGSKLSGKNTSLLTSPRPRAGMDGTQWAKQWLKQRLPPN